jgi:acyl-CoA reductase-like NAD-dependent aldehyde dehydrogenase
MPLAQTESFGPIAPFIRARDESEALEIADDTDLGLAAAVFTSDVEHGLRFAQQLETGMAHVNDQPVNDLPYSPFGGEKNSGIGRFNGAWAVPPSQRTNGFSVLIISFLPSPFYFSLVLSTFTSSHLAHILGPF